MIVRKLVVSDGRTEREVLLVGTIVVGRDPSCQLNDLDPLLSRKHAEFVPTSKGVTIRDLHSRNGILVNGDKVPECALKPGDVIQLGHLHVRYVEERVVKSPEDHNRVRAKTETGIDVATMAPPLRVVHTPARMTDALPTDPTESAPAVRVSDETDLDVTMAPPAKQTSPAPAPHSSATASTDDTAFDVTVAPVRATPAPPASKSAKSHADESEDIDATVAPSAHRAQTAHPAAPAHAAKQDEDADATRVPWAKGAAVAEDPDATVMTSGTTFDETRPPVAKPHVPAAPTRTALGTEARVVANASLVVTEASPSCQTVIGARPNTLVGGHLADAISRTLTFVATGDGPSSLSVSIARAPSGGTITVTFKAGQATENHS